MENKYINRYHTFCRSLKNLGKSRYADPKADFVLEGTVQNFNLTFELITTVFYDCFEKFKDHAVRYYVDNNLEGINSFQAQNAEE